MGLLYFFFFLMLLLPTSYSSIRAVLLLILCVKACIGSGSIDKKIQIYLLLNWILCFFNICYGVIAGNPGAIVFSTVFLIWPLLYMIFMIKCKSINIIYNLFKVIVYGGVIVLCTNALFFINQAFIGNGLLSNLAEILGYTYGIYDGFTEYYSQSQSYLPFFLYFSVTLLLIPHDRMNISNKWLIIMVVMSLILILLSGRRAMWLVVGVLPFELIGIMRIVNLKTNSLLKVITISCIMIFVLGYAIISFLDFDFIYAELLTSFDFETNDSNFERTMQYKSLLEDFCNNPILGNGIGFVSSYIRTPDKPWEYELTYNYLLASFGIVGILIMSFTYLFVIIRGIKIVRRIGLYSDLLLPALSGVFVMLIINASNPYLLKFDFLWIYFLPIIIINQVIKEENTNVLAK